MPVRGFIGSDYLNARPDFKVIQDPFTGEEVAVVPPITPDVALIHALKGDAEGNLLVDRIEDDHLLAQASQRVIASVEELVPAGALAETSEGLFVSGIYVTALIHAPRGAYPTGCRGYYEHDPAHIRRYVQAAKTTVEFQAYLEEYVLRPHTESPFIALVDGPP
jgi:glutaconate CoA-transferase, subunit A